MTTYAKSKNFYKFNHNRGLAVLNILIIISVFSLCFIYLVQTNGLVGCSYEIRRQKEQLGELRINNQELETQIAYWQSPVNLEEKIQSLGMVEVGQMTYLEIEKAVAKK